MVRTKGNMNAVKVSAAKAPRKYSSPSCHSSSINFSSPGTGSKKEKVGGNPACPRPTPDWQKPIGSFFIPVVKMPEEIAVNENNNNSVANEPENNAVASKSDDNKENENPVQNIYDKHDNDGMPGPSNRQSTDFSRKKRRVLMIESDSEEEASEKSLGCIADVEDKIIAS